MCNASMSRSAGTATDRGLMPWRCLQGALTVAIAGLPGMGSLETGLDRKHGPAEQQYAIQGQQIGGDQRQRCGRGPAWSGGSHDAMQFAGERIVLRPASYPARRAARRRRGQAARAAGRW